MDSSGASLCLKIKGKITTTKDAIVINNNNNKKDIWVIILQKWKILQIIVPWLTILLVKKIWLYIFVGFG